MMKPVFKQICLLLITLILGGCTLIELPAWLNFSSGQQETLQPQPSETATIVLPQIGTTPTSNVFYNNLVLWLPPQWDPESGSLAGSLLAVHLKAFEDENPDVHIEIRIKAEEGIGGLMESLTTTTASAPLALPSLAAMRQEDLEAAVNNGLILPLDSSLALDDPDWFNYARDFAQVKNTVYGLPFTGDAMVLLQRAQPETPPPQTWQDMLDQGRPVLFPVASLESEFTFGLYLSAGGSFPTSAGEQSLQQEALEEVFNLYASAGQRGVFPAFAQEFENDQQTWASFQSGQADSMVTWTSSYFLDPQDYSITPIPSLSEGSYSLATGWVWVLTDPLPERQEISIRLAEHLVDSAFLAEWSPVAGVLPVRPSSVSGWGNNALQATVMRIAQSAYAMPEKTILTTYGPALQSTTLQVIQLQVSPNEATQRVLDSIILQ